MNAAILEALPARELDGVFGAGWANVALRVAGRTGAKLVPWVGPALAVYSAYEGASAYNDARNHGDTVLHSTWEGAKAFVIGR